MPIVKNEARLSTKRSQKERELQFEDASEVRFCVAAVIERGVSLAVGAATPGSFPHAHLGLRRDLQLLGAGNQQPFRVHFPNKPSFIFVLFAHARKFGANLCACVYFRRLTTCCMEVGFRHGSTLQPMPLVPMATS